ncbi:uncharacterized protein RSE6_09397 [Rhynchosporium secalis]|uniref:Prp 4 CRoW domain-containing protein n=1 Tax=Rhynchosporium secalis TaxID=38038 RepID=A0A1E1MIZ9_RHYSE|nr:uncharacterized protein RSE6_09397 [Rhynchosporium secalis]
MYILSTGVVPGAVSTVAATISGQRLSKMALDGIFGRQFDTCVPVTAPATCEKSCGPGNIQCISFPTCYNPSAGETCCSDGKYCPSGHYCTDAGCCPSGITLAECGATISLSVIPAPPQTPPAPTSTARPTSTKELTRTPESTGLSQPTTSTISSTSRTGETSSTQSITTFSSTSSSSRGSISKVPPATVAPPSTSSTPVQVPANSASKLGTDLLLLVLGGLGAFMMV